MKGQQIIVSGNPRGTFLEGIITDTSLPGTIMEVAPGVATVGGRHSWRANPAPIGNPRGIFVLTPDHLQGKGNFDAYVAGTRCFLYAPLPGEEMNMLVDIPGTGTSPGSQVVSIGEYLEAYGNGHLTRAVSLTAALPFMSLENIADVSGSFSFLTWCLRL